MMTKKRHVTIALAAYNAASTIQRSIESILNQTYNNYDLYVVDDGSTDDTATKIKSILGNDSRLHFIKLDRNIGTYGVKNLILKYFTRGEFYAHQDADDFSLPERLEKQVNYLQTHPDVHACGTAIDEFFVDMKCRPRIPGEGQIIFDESSVMYHRHNQYPALICKGSLLKLTVAELVRSKIAMNGSIVFRANTVFGLGGFDGKTRVSGDMEFLWRFLFLYNFGNVSEVLYARFFHQDSLTQNSKFGHNSIIRRIYLKKAVDRFQHSKDTLKNSDQVGFKESLVYDYFIPEVNYEIIS